MIRNINGVKNCELTRTTGEFAIFKIDSRNDKDVRKDVFSAMAGAGYPIVEMRSETKSLEETFIDITTKDSVERGVSSR